MNLNYTLQFTAFTICRYNMINVLFYCDAHQKYRIYLYDDWPTSRTFFLPEFTYDISVAHKFYECDDYFEYT